MRPFQFKQLDLKPEGTRLTRILRSPHFRKTMLAAGLGALLGYAFFYFSAPADSSMLWGNEALSNILMGLGFGIFITNSPCARGRC
ncbi:MAG: hypothetical protein AB7U05_00290 [Mangrovibacterium sp.]